MTVSIIIAVKTWQSNLENCVAKCLALEYPDFEIVILSDEDFDRDFSYAAHPVRVVPTGAVNPARKRDYALTHAAGEIFAFLDDDAYPVPDWLTNAVRYFTDPNVAAVGGPAVTPPDDPAAAQASGIVYSSLLVSGGYRYRYIRAPLREVDDYPSCNLLVRASVMKALGGFKTDYWPGEDTKFCLDIRNLNKKIIYAPDVLVYHHRRNLFRPHFRQIASYALHRGYFAKKFPETSLRFTYFVPTVFVAGLVSGALAAVFVPFVRPLYFGVVVLYMTLVVLFSIANKIRLIPLVFSGIILTHVAYGVYFIKGLLSIRMPEDD